MKIVQINTFPNKSTGNLMMNIHETLTKNGYDSYVCWGRGRKSKNNHEIVFLNKIDTLMHVFLTRIFDKHGFGSKFSTKKLLKKLDLINPDIIHLHNVHGYYVNIEMLFNYIKQKKIKVIFTLHDCWTITGHCAYFDKCECNKWKYGCNKCEQLNTYPVSKILDNSKLNWLKKRELLTGFNAVIVTPSNWLANLVKESYLNEYPIITIHNGIDLNVFKPIQNLNLRKKYCLNEKPIVLGVASEWTQRKGLNDIIKLSQKMSDVQFVIVGLTNKQLKHLPKNIKGIKRTDNQYEMAALYTEASVFLNPTYEDNYPTTNLESIACGTPVITYDTGGSPEAIINNKVGMVIKKGTKLEILIDTIEFYIKNKSSKDCLNVARFFDKNNCIEKYIKLYNKI